jgi:hypothetical protein
MLVLGWSGLARMVWIVRDLETAPYSMAHFYAVLGESLVIIVGTTIIYYIIGRTIGALRR